MQNNESMSTVVETFYVEETLNLVHDGDALQKWNEKVEELGLAGQKQVVIEDKSPIPFLWMNSGLIATFETLCPTKVLIQQYDKTPIPVELLETVSLCVKENYFDKIEVWYNEQQKDPAIVGYKYKEGESTGWSADFYAKKYLIGRWADVKASLDALVARAVALFMHQSKKTLEQTIKDSQRRLEDLETIADQRFGNSMPSTSSIDLPF